MFKSYITGFLLSIVLTTAAYFAVVNQLLTGKSLITAIMGCALVQGLVQLFFFLHLGQRPARSASGEFTADGWKLAVLLSTIGIIFIIVVGSLWIMSNLNYNMMSMSPQEMDTYMQSQ